MARTRTNDPLQRFRFKVEINSVEFGAKTVSGLEKELETATYREGGYSVTHKLPGIATTGTLSIEKGAFANISLYNLVKSALEDNAFRLPVTIIEQDRHGNGIRQWELSECWAKKFTVPELDAESSEVSTETIEIEYENIIGSVL